MRRHAPAERLGEAFVVERPQIAVRESDDMPLDDCGDLLLVYAAAEPDPGRKQLADCGITADAGEDEHDGRQERFLVEQLDQLRATWHMERARSTASATIVGPVCSPPVGAAAVVHGAPATPTLAARTAGVVTDEPGLIPRNLDQRRVDLGLALSRQLAGRGREFGKQVIKAAANQDMLVQRHRPAFGDDDRHVATHL